MVIAKIVRGDEIRRVTFFDSTTYEELVAIVSNLFGITGPISFKYEDDEKDLVTASSTLELQEAIKIASASGRILRLQIIEKTIPEKSDDAIKIEIRSIPLNFGHRRRGIPHHRGPFGMFPFQFPAPQPESENPRAHNAFCDGCRDRIVGTRYKCNTCPDFDFCGKCRNQEHMGHSFTQIDDPKSIVHRAWCDSCNNWIVGSRYKCTQCPDFDLCGTCKSKEGVHDHPFIEITNRCPRFFRCATQQHPDNGVSIPIVHLQTEGPDAPTNVTPLESKSEEVQSESTPVAIPKADEPKIIEPQIEENEPLPEAPTEKNNEPASDDHPLKSAIHLLESMGFHDRSVMIPLLISKKLDVAATVQQLLDL
eukprot:TRINITY_DN7771_c0_g1_i1.p1 TRINITY_DN7771_c0_g1~~TRINITY_DN7771_c0_g1_i1.p1  ORF type:complete len:365 (-),score=93.57 TRINITY_DN7771_c0_g1_i1:43-1137(-)